MAGSQGHTQTYYDLLDAFKEEECPLCQLATAGLTRYFEAVDYEFVADPGYRSKLPPAHGFCNEHTAWWLKHGHVLATAMIYAEVFPKINEELHRAHFRPLGLLERAAGFLGNDQSVEADSCGVLVPTGLCPACEFLRELEATSTATLLEGLAESAFQDAYATSSGLCLRHLRQALCAAPDADTFATLRTIAIEGNEQLIGQLKEIIRKHDYRFHDEPSGEERGAAQRAARRAAAAHGVHIEHS